MCDKNCIFCFFPIINKYLCMAKRSLLSRLPSYFATTVLAFGETTCLIVHIFLRVSFVHSFHSFIHSISVSSSRFLPLFFPSSFYLSRLFFLSFLPLLYPFFFLTPPFVSWKLHAFHKPRRESFQLYGSLCNINSHRRFILLST